MHDLPCVLVPGGVTLPPTAGEDAGAIQSIGARFAHGEITLDRAAELKQTLLSPLASAGELEVDLSKVTELDSAGVQLMLLAQRTAAAKGVELRYVAHSAPVMQVLRLLGLGQALGAEEGVA
jgi:anti-anti-sigma factor